MLHSYKSKQMGIDAIIRDVIRLRRSEESVRQVPRGSSARFNN